MWNKRHYHRPLLLVGPKHDSCVDEPLALAAQIVDLVDEVLPTVTPLGHGNALLLRPVHKVSTLCAAAVSAGAPRSDSFNLAHCHYLFLLATVSSRNRCVTLVRTCSVDSLTANSFEGSRSLPWAWTTLIGVYGFSVRVEDVLKDVNVLPRFTLQ
jgi:hypothetical protein